MKLLLTSAGVKNASISDALVELLGKPIAESNALCIPTAAMDTPGAVFSHAWRFITGQGPTPCANWAGSPGKCWSLPRCPASIKLFGSRGSESDALLVAGGDSLYLCHWIRQSGLADLLPSLDETV